MVHTNSTHITDHGPSLHLASVAVEPEKVTASTYEQVAGDVGEEACTPARADCTAWDLEVEFAVDLKSSLDSSAVFRPDREHWTRRIVIRTPSTYVPHL
jgi:hypothetical protein